MLVGNDPHGFKVVAVLELPRGLLQLFVGDLIARESMADNQAQAVFRREFALVVQRKISGRAVVGVILGNHRVEIMARSCSRRRSRQGYSAAMNIEPGHSFRPYQSCRRKDADLSVKPRLRGPQRIDLNDAAHLSAKFRGNAGGINLEGIDVVGFDFRSEAPANGCR